MIYREIIRPTSQQYIIEIPEEFLNQEVEILVLPWDETSYLNSVRTNRELLEDAILEVKQFKKNNKK